VEDTGENRPMTERETGSEIMMRLLEKTLAFVGGFKEASNIFIFIYFFDQAA
jgi:hypothetical protein